jgi:hypothetical protein
LRFLPVITELILSNKESDDTAAFTQGLQNIDQVAATVQEEYKIQRSQHGELNLFLDLCK